MPADHTGFRTWQGEGYLFCPTCCLVLERSQVSRQRWHLVQLYFPLSSVFLCSSCSYLKRDNAHAAKQQFKVPLKLNFRMYVCAETLDCKSKSGRVLHRFFLVLTLKNVLSKSTFTEQDIFIHPLVNLLLLRVLFSYLCITIPSCIVIVDDSCII